MKEYHNNENDFISGGYISKELCDKIINHFNENEHNTELGEVGTVGVDPVAKISTELVYNSKKFFEIFPEYAKELDKVLKIYLKKYYYANEVNNFNVFDNVKIQFYKPNEGFFKWHFENDGHTPCIQRHLVFMTYLNDVEDGGTEFLYQKIKTKAEKGLTIIWPAHWTHTHRGIISKTKEKFIVTGWFDYQQFYNY
jgi:prolyl 4-hydroxylase